MDIDLCFKLIENDIGPMNMCEGRFYYSTEKKICGCFFECMLDATTDVIKVPKSGFKEYRLLKGNDE